CQVPKIRKTTTPLPPFGSVHQNPPTGPFGATQSTPPELRLDLAQLSELPVASNASGRRGRAPRPSCSTPGPLPFRERLPTPSPCWDKPSEGSTPCTWPCTPRPPVAATGSCWAEGRDRPWWNRPIIG